ncbi:MAG: hypothetical protein DMF69_02195 [Acidobacteria bacterium]|nr:MAG: hypothetical protein DMF69_02195 [Acidobacteriota bacterium]
MSGYFSFQRLITTSVVKAIYALGFLILTGGAVTLIVWAGLGLNDANISRELGWRYIAIGAGSLVLGNLAWRIVCEFWMVLFNINDHLAFIGQATSLNRVSRVNEVQFVERRVATRDRRTANKKSEVVATREISLPSRDKVHAERSSGVLGLS